MKRKYLYIDSNLPDEDRTHAVPQAKQLAENAVNEFETEKQNNKNLQDIESGDILTKEVNDINQYRREVPHGQHPELWGNREHNTIMAQFLNPAGDVAEEIVSSDTPKNIDRDEYYDSFAPLDVTNPENQVGYHVSPGTEDTWVTPSPNFLDLAETGSIGLAENESFHHEQDLLNSAEVDTMYPVGALSEEGITAPTVISATTGGGTFSSIHDPVSNDNIPLDKEASSNSHKRKREDDETDNEQESSRHRITEDIAEDTISSIYDLAGDD